MIYQTNFTLLKRAFFLDIVALLFISIFLAGQAHAAAGDLDTSFNGTGKVFTNLGLSTNWSDDIKVLADNKFLVVGSVNPGILLVRYNSDGTPDASFGSNGKVISNAGSGGVGVDLQSDGKIIVVGVGGSGTVILRFHPNGSLDNTFGSNGMITSSQQGAADVAIQTDGKIVIVGYPTGTPGVAVRRFNSDGSVDTGFGNSGLATTTFGENSTTASKVALQSDGKIVVAGTAEGPGGHDFAVARFNVDGSLDGTFGGGTQRVTLNGIQICYGLAVQPDGKIILAGQHTTLNNNYDFFLVRFNPNGSIDTDFGGGLLTVTISPDPDYIFDMALQADGKILVFGQTQEEFLTHFIVTRLNSNGSFDKTFGSGGKTIIRYNLSSRAWAAGLRSDGQIIVTGVTSIDVAVAQISPTGTVQVQRQDNFSRGNDTAQDVAIQPDGKIVAVGYSQYGNSTDFSLARYLPSGALDNSFGIGGKVTTQFNNSTEAFGIAIQPDGKIVVVGRRGGYPFYSVVLTRYNSDGSLDEFFGSGGITILSRSASIAGSDVAIQPDGKIVVAGFINQSFMTVIFQFMVARFEANGAPDSGFANNGVYVTNASPANALVIQPDGKIVAGGAQLIRLNSNGTADPTFNSGNPVTLALTINDMALQPDGKIVLGGTAIPDFAIARYLSNGNPDSGFGANGIRFIDFGGTEVANGLVLQSDGAIIAGGYSESGSPVQRNFALARVTSSGILDTRFGIGGKVITALGNGNEQILGLGLQRNGRLVAVGEAKPGTDFDYAVTRYFAQTKSPFDFDGDGKTDISIFRPSVGEWWLLRSSDGGNGAVQFGNSSDKRVPADYTGDGKTDVAIWRPSVGEWFILRSEDFSYYAFPFGTNGDTPAPADYDGDGRADATVFRPSSSTWYINRSSDGGTTIQQFGANGDAPVAADYDGDGRADIAIFRPSVGEWWVNRSSNGSTFALQFGSSTDKPVQGDYTGDAKADVAFWRPSTGEWFVLRSEDQSYYSFHFGTNGDMPAPGDYDGDGKFDAAIFRPSGSTWYVQRSTAGLLIQGFGQSGDLPVPNAFVP